jgi:multidrug resistance efflux pump
VLARFLDQPWRTLVQSADASLPSRTSADGAAGILGLSLLFITMAYNHPFSTNARIYFAVTPILPSVRGRVIEVPVEDRTNQRLEAGEVLFKIDPKPFEYAVQEKRAGLADAEANVAQLKASVDQASATTAKAKAQLQLAQENYDRQLTLFQKNVVAQATLDTATRNLDTAKQATAEAALLRIVPGKRMVQPLTVNTRSSCVYAMSSPMLNTI